MGVAAEYCSWHKEETSEMIRSCPENDIQPPARTDSDVDSSRKKMEKKTKKKSEKEWIDEEIRDSGLEEDFWNDQERKTSEQ